MPKDNLAEILMRANLLDEVGLERAQIEQKRWGGSIGRHLVDLGLITEETLVRALSSIYKLPAVALDPPRMNQGVAKLIPREICERHCLIAFRADVAGKVLQVAMAEPSQLDAVDEVRLATKYTVQPNIAARSAIEQAITHVFYGGSPTVGNELELEPNGARDSGKQQTVDPFTMGSRSEREFESRELQTLEPGYAPADVVGGTIDPNMQRAPLDSRPLMIADDPNAAIPSDLDERLTVLEATMAQTRGAFERLLRELIKKQVFSREEIMSFLREL